MKIGWKSKQHIKNPNQIGNPENYQIFRSNCYEKYNDGTRLILKTHWKRPPPEISTNRELELGQSANINKNMRTRLKAEDMGTNLEFDEGNDECKKYFSNGT